MMQALIAAAAILLTALFFAVIAGCVALAIRFFWDR